MSGRISLTTPGGRSCPGQGRAVAHSHNWRPRFRRSAWVVLVLATACGSPGLQDAFGQRAEKELTTEAERATEDAASDVPSPSDGAVKSRTVEPRQPEREITRQDMLIASLTVFLLAIFVGFEVITKVPPTLHTPLMSGSNAISGIAIVGALIVAGRGLGFAPFLGFIAVTLATINVVGGFLVTHRMLAMFKKKR